MHVDRADQHKRAAGNRAWLAMVQQMSCSDHVASMTQASQVREQQVEGPRLTPAWLHLTLQERTRYWVQSSKLNVTVVLMREETLKVSRGRGTCLATMHSHQKALHA